MTSSLEGEGMVGQKMTCDDMMTRGTVPQNWGPGGHFRFQPFSGIRQTKESSVRLG